MSSPKHDALRRQIRTLEALVEAKLASYSRLAATVSKPNDLEAGDSSNERWRDLEMEIEGLLEKLRETNEQLTAQLNDPINPPSQTMLHAIHRHRDVLKDYAQDFSRTKANVQAALDRANLLDNVRNDINSYKAGQSSVTESLLNERSRIDSSHRMTDDVLNQAYETRAEFSRQRSTLSGIQGRMGGVLSTLPGINSLLGMIQSRRRRDSVIVGCLIGLCTILLLSYISR